MPNKKTQSGKYSLKNPKKYRGNKNEIFFRSSWERKVFHYLDHNPVVTWWASEEIIVPYICETDGKPHRYFPDILFETTSKKVYMIEIKPAKETKEPRKSKNKERFLSEVLTYVKNQSKWKHAESFCNKQGWEFHIWTENELRKLGLKI